MLRDLEIQRRNALQRVRSQIVVMEKQLRVLASDAPTRYLAEGLLKTLRRNEATLAQKVSHGDHRPTSQIAGSPHKALEE